MELILVLVVIGVVLALNAPSLRGFFASRRTADTASTLLALTKWAQSEAVTNGHLCRLNVDAASGTFWLTVQEAGVFVEKSFDMGRRFQAPEGASLSLRNDALTPSASKAPLNLGLKKNDSAPAAASYIQFYPSGRKDAATIEITDRGGQVFQITCPSATDPFQVISPSEASNNG
jgi:Tfp pilus assembly protein FimT